MPNPAKTTWRFGYAVIEQFFDDGCLHRAAALTYTTLLALVPLMTASFVLIKALPVAQAWSSKIQELILTNFVPSAAQTVQTYLENFAEQANNLSTPSFAFLFITAILLLINIEQALNDLWKVKKKRKNIIALFLYLAIITITPVLMAIAIGISTYLWSLPFISGTASHLGLAKPILRLLPYLLTFLAFSLLYWIVPNCKVGLRNALAGGAIAMLLFETAKSGFGLYVRYFPTYKLLYGALAAIPIFLVWIYVSWSIILLGAVVGHQLYLMRR